MSRNALGPFGQQIGCDSILAPTTLVSSNWAFQDMMKEIMSQLLDELELSDEDEEEREELTRDKKSPFAKAQKVSEEDLSRSSPSC